MNINFNLKNSLKKTREQYVKEFKVNADIKIEPCDKFVACLEKLSKNYVLALRDNSNIETLQTTNQNDIEFYEGYELASRYTDDLRKQLCISLNKISHSIFNIISILKELEDVSDIDNKNMFNDIKLDFNVIKCIIQNIYQHLTMTNDSVNCNSEVSIIKDKLKCLRRNIVELIDMLIDMKSKIIIEYIVRQLDIVIDKILNHFNKINIFD